MAEHPYDDGDRALGVSLARHRGEETVCLESRPPAVMAHLTSDQARALAADLVAHADALDELTRTVPRD